MATTTLSNQRLLELNHQGLIPGPGETEDAFLLRADQCLHLKEKVFDELRHHIVFSADDLGSPVLMEKAHQTTTVLYDIKPTWIPLFFSNYQLMPWHGGCAWIFQTQPDMPKMAFFQLRRHFATHECFLGLYQRDDLIAHELAHVGRMAFDEPRYEEILAYQTTPSSFRRWLGPLLQSSHEALIFIGLLFLCLIVDAFALISHKPHALLAAMWWKLLPAAYFIYLFMRLAWRQHRFTKCRQRLLALTDQERNADAILYRLTDDEINRFSRSSPEDIRTYVREQAANSLRWRVIQMAYLFP